MDLKNKKIAFLGDSITEGVGATDFYGYVDYIAEWTGAECSNFGISGTRIARQKKSTVDSPSFDLDFCIRAEEIDGDYDIFVIFGGTNDFDHGDADFGEFSDNSPDTFYGALHTLYRTVTRMHPDSEIVVITPVFRCDEEEIIHRKGRNLKAYGDAIKEVAKVYDLTVLDLLKKGEPPYDKVIDNASLLADLVHPNDEGHKLIAKQIIHFLENNL